MLCCPGNPPEIPALCASYCLQTAAEERKQKSPESRTNKPTDRTGQCVSRDFLSFLLQSFEQCRIDQIFHILQQTAFSTLWKLNYFSLNYCTLIRSFAVHTDSGTLSGLIKKGNILFEVCIHSFKYYNNFLRIASILSMMDISESRIPRSEI